MTSRPDLALIVLGVSAGGFSALKRLLAALPAGFPLPLIIVQHQRAGQEGHLATQLNRISPLQVKEADEGDSLCPATVYLAPANYHLLVERDGTLALSVDPQVCYARPAIDVLFESAAAAYGPRLAGIVLTGANNDGSAGLRAIKNAGGLAIVQDPDDAEVKQMPQNALRSVAADYVVPLTQLAPLLCALANHPAPPPTPPETP